MCLSNIHAVEVNDSLSQHFINQGDYWYKHRADEAKGDMTNSKAIDRAVSFYQKAQSNPNFEKQAYLKLMDAWCFKASHAFTSKNESESIFKSVSYVAQKMIKKYPQEAGFYYWYALSYSLWVKDQNIFIMITENAANDIKSSLEKSIELDSTFKNGFAYLNLAALYYKLPKVPFISPWVSSEKALKLLNIAARQLSNDVNYMYFRALYYYETGKKKDAAMWSKKILKKKIRSDFSLEDLRMQWRAYLLLKKINKGK